jgi:hypothetical protein
VVSVDGRPLVPSSFAHPPDAKGDNIMVASGQSYVGSRRGDPMRRRHLLFGLLAVATMGGARAEPSKKAYRIAIAAPAEVSEASNPVAQAFLNELRRLGYVEGDNLSIERFSGEGRATHYPDLAQDIVRRKPDVIFAVPHSSPSISRQQQPQFRLSAPSAIRSSRALSLAWRDLAAISPGSPSILGRSSGTSESNCSGRWCRI